MQKGLRSLLMMNMDIIYLLDLAGTAVFAISGVQVAGQMRMDPFGATVLAAVTAVGGGTIRDAILDAGPAFWVHDPVYLSVIILTSLLTILFANRNHRMPPILLPLADAAGLALFTVIGTQKALAYGAPGMTAVVMGVLTGVAGGIIIGVCAGLLYNRFHAIKLPEFLGFFGGKRFVPIITGLVALILAFAFSVIWPPVQDGINHLGQWILTSGVPGEFVYGVANRLLIPLGLHHILNSMVWFVFGNYTDPATGQVVTGEISRFFAGDPSAGRILSGFFPVVMFGLPSAALAFYVTAKKENKKVVGGMLLSVALTAFLTGITEPIEFMFMFLAPGLYVVHAILMGLSIVVASMLNIHMAFSFSSGLIDYILNFNAPAAHNSWEIIPMGLVVGALYFVIFVGAIKMFNLKTPGREDAPEEDSNPDSDSKADLAVQYLAALGGKDNLTDISACITRLRLGIVDRTIINDAKLKQLGAKGVVNVGSNNLQVIIGPQAEIIANQMKAL
jgi:PTS system N-acetylglucosamine-specific IIC component